MIVTNRHGIKSKSVIDALTHDPYDASNTTNVFSCTEIIDDPKVQVLRRRHWEEIETDVSDYFWALDGSAIHYAIEMSNKRSKQRERLSEERIFIRIPKSGAGDWAAYTLPHHGKIVDHTWYSQDCWYVTVRFDNYEFEEAVVEDYKRTTVWEAVFGVKEGRERQLNIGAIALRLLGFPTRALRVCMFIRDWNSREFGDAKRSGKFYPPIPYAEADMKLWNDDFTKAYILERLQIHVKAQAAADDEIPECSPEGRWQNPGAFAVLKQGNITAKRVFKINRNRDDAMAMANECLEKLKVQYPKEAEKFSIEEREGVDARCSNPKGYCSARKFCHYYKQKYGGKNEENKTE